MKYWITCCECHEEHKHDCGTGKAAEKTYNRIKDNWVCPECQAKREAEKKAAANEKKVAEGWAEITVHYSVYKNEYEGKINAKGEKVQKGEYHADTKEIDLLVPAGKLVELNDDEMALFNRDFANILAGETEEEFEAKKAALMARFEEEPESADEPEMEIDETAELPADDADFEEQIEWESLPVDDCYIEKMTDKAVLLRMPSNSDYPGYKFWHPIKCFPKHDGIHDLRFTDDWDFVLQANGGAIKVNIDGAELVNALPGRGFARYERPDEIYTPMPMAPIENPVADEELVDND